MVDAKAYTEVYYIINEMSEELRSLIPEKLIQNIKAKMDTGYEFNIEDEDIENLELLEDTEKILSVLYTDYLATEEERQVIKAKERAIAEEKRPKVEVRDLFVNKSVKNNQSSYADSKRENELVKMQTEKWYIKILNFIKNIFRKS